MSHQYLGPEDPREWLNRARSNLNQARLSFDKDVYLEDLCFQCQQAAEKAIRAVLVDYSVDFPRTYALQRLLEHVEEVDLAIPGTVSKTTLLTGNASVTRYPGIFEPVSEEEYRNVVAIAADVVSWAEVLKAKSD